MKTWILRTDPQLNKSTLKWKYTHSEVQCVNYIKQRKLDHNNWELQETLVASSSSLRLEGHHASIFRDEVAERIRRIQHPVAMKHTRPTKSSNLMSNLVPCPLDPGKSTEAKAWFYEINVMKNVLNLSNLFYSPARIKEGSIVRFEDHILEINRSTQLEGFSHGQSLCNKSIRREDSGSNRCKNSSLVFSTNNTCASCWTIYCSICVNFVDVCSWGLHLEKLKLGEPVEFAFSLVDWDWKNSTHWVLAIVRVGMGLGLWLLKT